MRIRIETRKGEDPAKAYAADLSIEQVREGFGNELANFFVNRLRVGDKIIFVSEEFAVETSYKRIA